MAKVQPLTNPPIREAVIDMRVSTVLAEGVGSLEGACELLSEEYPTRRELTEREIGVHLHGKKEPEATFDRTTQRGYRLESEDGKSIAQLRTNGFTFSRLAPYDCWESLRDEARRLWGIYVDHGNPEAVRRVAVRYINGLRFPLPVNDFADYLTCPPQIPEELPQDLIRFLTRVAFRKEEISATCVLTQSLEGVDGERAAIILDVDAFNQEQYAPSDELIWEKLEALRDFKNLAFFSSITNSAVEMYK